MGKRLIGQVLVEVALAVVGLVVLGFVCVRVGQWVNHSMVERNADFQMSRGLAGTPGAGVVKFYLNPTRIHLLGPDAASSGAPSSIPEGLSTAPPSCPAGASLVTQINDLRALILEDWKERDDLLKQHREAVCWAVDLEMAGSGDYVTTDVSSPAGVRSQLHNPTGASCEGKPAVCSEAECRSSNWYWQMAQLMKDVIAEIDKAQKAVDDAQAALDACLAGGGKGGGTFSEHRVLPGVVRISSRFGAVADAPTHRRHSPHAGIDLVAPEGTPVLAFEAGRVVAVSNDPEGYGRYVMLSHGEGRQTLYAHLRRVYVREGQALEAGAFLGELGSTGASTGAHLHFELILEGRRVDPEPYLMLSQGPAVNDLPDAYGKDEPPPPPPPGGKDEPPPPPPPDGGKDGGGGKGTPDCSAEQAALDAAKATLADWKAVKVELCDFLLTGNPKVGGAPASCDPADLEQYARDIDSGPGNDAHDFNDDAKDVVDGLKDLSGRIQSRMLLLEELERQARATCSSEAP